MVHARAFSFTDDAINVAFPSMIGVLQIHPQQTVPNGSQSLHPPPPPPAAAQSPISPSSAPAASSALLLFQLRRAQSHWYQTLYQSDVSEELENPTAYVWRMCADMREWYDALPLTIPAKIREMFDLELQYSYVYCIAPSARSPLMTAYGRMLMFEHVIAYVDRMMALASGGLNLVWHTYHDALRVFFMGSQFVAVLRDTSTADAILAGGGSVPVPLAMPGDTPPPPMPARTTFPVPPQAASPSNPNPLSNVDPVTGTNIDRAIACLERVSWTLSAYGARWEDAERLATGFKTVSRGVLDSLLARKAVQDKEQQQQQDQQPKGGMLTLASQQQHMQQYSQQTQNPPVYHGLPQYQTHPQQHQQHYQQMPPPLQQQHQRPQQQQQQQQQPPQYPPPHMQYQAQQLRQPQGAMPLNFVNTLQTPPGPSPGRR